MIKSLKYFKEAKESLPSDRGKIRIFKKDIWKRGREKSINLSTSRIKRAPRVEKSSL